MSDGVYDMPEEPRRPRRTSGGRPRALLPTIATLIVLLWWRSIFITGLRRERTVIHTLDCHDGIKES